MPVPDETLILLEGTARHPAPCEGSVHFVNRGKIAASGLRPPRNDVMRGGFGAFLQKRKFFYPCHVIARPKAVAIRFPLNRRNPKDFFLNSSFLTPHSSLLPPYAHTSQITSAPETAAMRVKGMPMRRKSFVSTL